MKNGENIYFALLCAGILVLTASPMMAAAISWLNPVSGDFNSATNWSGGVLPGTNDYAVFDHDATYTVTWSAAATNRGCHVPRGTVTFDLNGNTNFFWPLGGIGYGTATTKVDVTISNGVFSKYNAVNGYPVVKGTGTIVKVINSGYLDIQRASFDRHTTLILDGLGVNGNPYQAGFSGTIIVTNQAMFGENSAYSTFYDGSITILDGTGTVSRLGEYRIYCGESDGFYIRHGALARGWGGIDMTISTNSHCVLDGGIVGNDGTVKIRQGYLEGSGEIRANVLNGGWVKPGGTNAIGLLDMTTSGRYFTNSNAGVLGGIEIELAGTEPEAYDRLHVNGTFYAGGTCTVSLISGFQPQQGASFDILDWTSVSNAFDSMVLPGGEANWDLRKLYSDGEIRYLHPGTVVVFR